MLVAAHHIVVGCAVGTTEMHDLALFAIKFQLPDIEPLLNTVQIVLEMVVIFWAGYCSA